MTSALNTVAAILGRCQVDDAGVVVRNHDGAPRGDWRQVDWRTLNAANVDAIMAHAKGAPATRNKVLAALRGVAKAAYKADVIDVGIYQKISLCRGDDGRREMAGRAVEAWEYESLIRVCCQDPTPAGARDAAMIAIAYYTGCRRAELAGMRYQDLTIGAEHAEITVIGKRNKQRTLDIDNGALHALQDWLAMRGQAAGPLFYAINKGGRILAGHGLTTTSLDAILIKRARQAGLQDVDWHDLRRTVVSELIDAGVDFGTIAKIIGHSDIKTTQRYDRRKDDARRAGIRRRSVAYFGRPAELIH